MPTKKQNARQQKPKQELTKADIPFSESTPKPSVEDLMGEALEAGYNAAACNDRTTRLIMSASIFGALRANSRASAEMVEEAILSAQQIIDADGAMRKAAIKK